VSTLDAVVAFAYVGLPVFVLAVGYVAGKIAERNHYKSIRRREHGFLSTPTVTWKTLTDKRPIRYCELAIGSVVISVDHYKRFLMAWGWAAQPKNGRKAMRHLTIFIDNVPVFLRAPPVDSKCTPRNLPFLTVPRKSNERVSRSLNTVPSSLPVFRSPSAVPL